MYAAPWFNSPHFHLQDDLVLYRRLPPSPFSPCSFQSSNWLFFTIWNGHEWLQAAIKSNPILVYSKSYCPYCRRAKALLASIPKKIAEPKIFELDLMGQEGVETQAYLAKLTGQGTVPNVSGRASWLASVLWLTHLNRSLSDKSTSVGRTTWQAYMPWAGLSRSWQSQSLSLPSCFRPISRYIVIVHHHAGQVKTHPWLAEPEGSQKFDRFTSHTIPYSLITTDLGLRSRPHVSTHMHSGRWHIHPIGYSSYLPYSFSLEVRSGLGNVWSNASAKQLPKRSYDYLVNCFRVEECIKCMMRGLAHSQLDSQSLERPFI